MLLLPVCKNLFLAVLFPRKIWSDNPKKIQQTSPVSLGKTDVDVNENGKIGVWFEQSQVVVGLILVPLVFLRNYACLVQIRRPILRAIVRGPRNDPETSLKSFFFLQKTPVFP